MKFRATLFSIVALALPTAAHAQTDTASYSAPTPKWVGQFTTASANVLLSGGAAGIIQELRGGSFRDGFTRGALGGAVIYAAKRVVVEDFFGAGLIGRQIGGIGNSIVRNASDGIGTLDRVVLPVGIARVYWQRRAPQRWRAKLDAVAAGWTIYGVLEDELQFELDESISAGTPVFRTNAKVISLGDSHAGGIVQAGVIFRSDVRAWGQVFLRRALAHERVHVLQMDQIFLTWNDPYDDVVLRKLPGGRALDKWVDVNLSTELLRLLAIPIDRHADRPWELEAIYLTR